MVITLSKTKNYPGPFNMCIGHMKANHTFAIKTKLATPKSEDFLGSGKFLITTPCIILLVVWL